MNSLLEFLVLILWCQSVREILCVIIRIIDSRVIICKYFTAYICFSAVARFLSNTLFFYCVGLFFSFLITTTRNALSPYNAQAYVTGRGPQPRAPKHLKTAQVLRAVLEMHDEVVAIF